MKISIITPTFNSAKTISRAIESVVKQNYSDLEYIVIDGGSSDGTQDIVLNFKDKLNVKLIFEKDNGIYDAMNKGIKMATGDIVGILNSDDLYNDDLVLSLVASSFQDPTVDAVYGDISYFSKDVSKVVRYWKAGEYQEKNLNNGWAIPHPALFVRKEIYNKYGSFDSSFEIAADYEFVLKLLKIHKINIKYIPKVFVKMFNGGASGSSFIQRLKGFKELKKAWTLNKLKYPHLFTLRRVLSKIFQFSIF
jgi:glycosyltransferase involved in cell wall biosynthesis